MPLIRQTTGAINTSIASTVTLSGAASAGNYLVAAIAMDQSPAPALSSISTTGVTWSKLGNQANGNVEVEVWLGTVTATSGTSVGFTLASGTAVLVCNISEFSLFTASPVDVTAVVSFGTGASPSTGSYSTINASDTVFAMAGWENANPPPGTPSGYTALTTSSGSGLLTVSAAYKPAVAPGAQSAAWSMNGAADWATIIVAFKESPVVVRTATHTTSAALRGTLTKPHTTSAALRATSTRTHTTSAALFSRRTGTHTTSSVLAASRTATHTTSAFLVEGGIRHFTDALLRATFTRSHTTSAALKATRTITQTTSSALAARRTVAHTSNAHLKGTITRTHTTSAAMVRRSTVAHTTSGFLKNRPLPAPSAAAIRVGAWTTTRPSG